MYLEPIFLSRSVREARQETKSAKRFSLDISEPALPVADELAIDTKEIVTMIGKHFVPRIAEVVRRLGDLERMAIRLGCNRDAQ